MEDSRSTARSSSPVVAAAVILLLLAAPLLYLLSTGPVVWLAENGFVTDTGWMGMIYAPIGYLMDHSTWFEALMDWYLGLFVE